jgi:hypothetical protein
MQRQRSEIEFCGAVVIAFHLRGKRFLEALPGLGLAIG